MTGKRPAILVGMLAGLLWTMGVLWVGQQIPVPIGLIQPVLMGALFAPGVVLVLVIGRLAQRRFFDDATVDGQPFRAGSGADIDQRVLTNTIEQIALALCLWPLVGFFLGAGMVLTLGLSFGVARMAFWIGYHVSPPLRAFGFAATFYPTVAAAGLTFVRLLT